MSNTAEAPAHRSVSSSTNVEATPNHESPALGFDGPTVVVARNHRKAAFSQAFNDAWVDGFWLSEAGEMDPPNIDRYKEAFRVSAILAGFYDAPVVVPLQMGGVSVSWHQHDLDLEFRFRTEGAHLAVVCDQRKNLVDFFDYDRDGEIGRKALRALAARSYLR